MDRQKLREDLIRDEGVRKKPYHCTAGKLTIGVGRNLDDRGLREDEIQYLLDNDIQETLNELEQTFPWFPTAPEHVQRAVANMTFNLGLPTLLTFRRMIAALKAGDYRTAAAEARKSRWYTQVGARGERVTRLMEGLP